MKGSGIQKFILATVCATGVLAESQSLASEQEAWLPEGVYLPLTIKPGWDSQLASILTHYEFTHFGYTKSGIISFADGSGLLVKCSFEEPMTRVPQPVSFQGCQAELVGNLDNYPYPVITPTQLIEAVSHEASQAN
jgi:hypothetical protein